ncbi:MAG: DUF2934 domain-containing protein [Bryobacteraceae bacterium]|nr:DUF2934 domain-containing protein [Bryobacteraceae bacterium]
MEDNGLQVSDVNPAADLAEEIGWVAYLYWKAEGCPEGHSLRHWLQAERDVLAARRIAPPEEDTDL